MYWTKSLRKGSLQRMNHMAITWWARDTIYWLNLMRKEEIFSCECTCRQEYTFVCEHLLRRVGVGQWDGKYTNILLSYKVGIQMGQAYQSCEIHQMMQSVKTFCVPFPLTENSDLEKRKCIQMMFENSLERNSSIGDAMATVAEMCVSLTMRAGRSLIMISGISTVHIVRATTHCLAQR